MADGNEPDWESILTGRLAQKREEADAGPGPGGNTAPGGGVRDAPGPFGREPVGPEPVGPEPDEDAFEAPGPVRLSDLTPPDAPHLLALPHLPALPHAGPSVSQGGRWPPANEGADVVAELDERLRKSEEDRKLAEGRALQLEWQLSDLQGRLGMSEEARAGAEARAVEPGSDLADIRDRFRDRFHASEEARLAAEARAADLEQLVAELRSNHPPAAGSDRANGFPVPGNPYGGGAPGDGAEIERLRGELAAAYALIKSIEDAYLAGERRRNGGP